MKLADLFPDPFVDLAGYRKVAFPRERVWQWMLTHPCELLGVEGFHARIERPELPLAKGDRIRIHHELPFGYRESRDARINKLVPHEIGFGEVADPGVYDFFPHSYRFTVAKQDEHSCVVGFDVRGRFHIPAARLVWMPWFQWLAPRRLDAALERLDALLRRDLSD